MIICIFEFYLVFSFFYKKKYQKLDEHWQDIEFEIDDPSLDLITVGKFGAMEMLYGITKYQNLYEGIFKYLLKNK